MSGTGVEGGSDGEGGVTVSQAVFEAVNGVALGACVATCVVSLWGVFRHLQHYTRPSLQRYVVRICLMVPVYSLMSYLSLSHPSEALIFDTIRDVYEAWVVYCFLVLVLEYAGGEGTCANKLADNPPMRHPWPLCKLSPIALDTRFLRRCKQGALQFVVIKPVMAVISLSLLASGAYDSTVYQIILLLVYNLSYTMALYALLLFYLATKVLLAPFHPVWKFLAVKSVVFLTYWQGLLVGIIPGLSAEEAELLNDAILSVEMVFFALLHLCAFSYREFELRDGVPIVSVLKNATDVVNMKDVVADLHHNVLPAYSTYSLHKPYEESPDKVYRARTFLFGLGGRRRPTGMAEADGNAKLEEGDISGSDDEVGVELPGVGEGADEVVESPLAAAEPSASTEELARESPETQSER